MKMNLEEALKYAKTCSINGYDDWRIPSIQEWFTILSYKHNNINLSIFNFNTSSYWSSTTLANYPSNAWIVYFGNGYVYYYNKYLSFYVRCVRGGQYDKLGNLIIHNLQDSEELFTIKENTIIDNRTGLEWSIA